MTGMMMMMMMTLREFVVQWLHQIREKKSRSSRREILYFGIVIRRRTLLLEWYTVKMEQRHAKAASNGSIMPLRRMLKNMWLNTLALCIICIFLCEIAFLSLRLSVCSSLVFFLFSITRLSSPCRISLSRKIWLAKSTMHEDDDADRNGYDEIYSMWQ